MKVYGKDLEGQDPWHLLPYAHAGHDSDLLANLAALRRYLDAGGKVMVEITKGARKGTIGELTIPSTDINELYGARYRSGLGGDRRQSKVTEWYLKFDDRKTTIKISKHRYDYDWKGVLRFDRDATVWNYESKPRPKEELPELTDHFGVPLAVGQVVLALIGKGSSQYVRLGKITRWSAKATIWIETMKTHPSHPENSEVIVQGSINIFVLDGDIRSKAIMAKMTFS